MYHIQRQTTLGRSDFSLDIFYEKNLNKITFIWCAKVVGYVSSSSCFIAAVPRNKSNCVPGGNNPGKQKRNILPEWGNMLAVVGKCKNT